MEINVITLRRETHDEWFWVWKETSVNTRWQRTNYSLKKRWGAEPAFDPREPIFPTWRLIWKHILMDNFRAREALLCFLFWKDVTAQWVKRSVTQAERRGTGSCWCLSGAPRRQSLTEQPTWQNTCLKLMPIDHHEHGQHWHKSTPRKTNYCSATTRVHTHTQTHTHRKAVATSQSRSPSAIVWKRIILWQQGPIFWGFDLSDRRWISGPRLRL